MIFSALIFGYFKDLFLLILSLFSAIKANHTVLTVFYQSTVPIQIFKKCIGGKIKIKKNEKYLWTHLWQVGANYPKQITDIVECAMSVVTVGLLIM